MAQAQAPPVVQCQHADRAERQAVLRRGGGEDVGDRLGELGVIPAEFRGGDGVGHPCGRGAGVERREPVIGGQAGGRTGEDGCARREGGGGFAAAGVLAGAFGSDSAKSGSARFANAHL